MSNRTVYQYIAGVDEVGRGPLVGNVVTAAVILDKDQPIAGLADSKKLSAKKREQLAEEIKAKALAWAVASASPEEILELNILGATFLAMQRAVAALSPAPEFVYIDGNRCPELPYPAEAVVQGDGKVAEISAASILAKVTRDQEMLVLDASYPEYGFAQHKGYPTPAHLEALKQHGPIAEHRKGFRPVAELLER